MANIKINKIASHRNGISGEPFYVVLFHDKDIEADMVATVFEEPGYVAVLAIGETVKANIEFGNGNSWRGDHFEKDLRDAIAEWEKAL